MSKITSSPGSARRGGGTRRCGSCGGRRRPRCRARRASPCTASGRGRSRASTGGSPRGTASRHRSRGSAGGRSLLRLGSLSSGGGTGIGSGTASCSWWWPRGRWWRGVGRGGRWSARPATCWRSRGRAAVRRPRWPAGSTAVPTPMGSRGVDGGAGDARSDDQGERRSHVSRVGPNHGARVSRRRSRAATGRAELDPSCEVGEHGVGGALGVGDARRHPDAAVAGAGEEQPGREWRLDRRPASPRWCGRYCGNAPGHRGHAHGGRLQVDAEVPADLVDRGGHEGGVVAVAERAARRVRATPAAPRRRRRQWAHFCEPNDAAVTSRCSGLGTR